MVGVFIVMWLAALMALAASGMQHRDMATRFLAYTQDRTVAFAAADRALLVARERLICGAQATEIAALSEFDAGPHDVMPASYLTSNREPNKAVGWAKVDWNGAGVIATDNARYFIERVAFTGYSPNAAQVKIAVESPIRRYRVSAVGCGKLPGTRVFLQAVYEVKALRGRRDTARGASDTHSSRLLNWREVVAWHDGSVVKAELGRHREPCDV